MVHFGTFGRQRSRSDEVKIEKSTRRAKIQSSLNHVKKANPGRRHITPQYYGNCSMKFSALILALAATAASAFTPSTGGFMKMSMSPSQGRREALSGMGAAAATLLGVSPVLAKEAEPYMPEGGLKGSLKQYDPKMNRDDMEKASRSLGIDKAKAKALK